MIGIYGCNGKADTIMPGTKCYKITSAAAISEWIMAIAFVNYLLTLAYSCYYGDAIRRQFYVRVEDDSEGLLKT